MRARKPTLKRGINGAWLIAALSTQSVAITALAGSVLILRGETWPLLGPLLPFLRGFTFFFWAVASWWIPFLFALMLWRYVWMRDRFTYEPAVWGMVFPLGM